MRPTSALLEKMLREDPNLGPVAMGFLGLTVEDLFGWTCSSAVDVVVLRALKTYRVTALIEHLAPEGVGKGEAAAGVVVDRVADLRKIAVLGV